jgi:hypothetical protein
LVRGVGVVVDRRLYSTDLHYEKKRDIEWGANCQYRDRAGADREVAAYGYKYEYEIYIKH